MTTTTIKEMRKAAENMTSSELLDEFARTAVWKNEAKNKEAFGDEHLMAMEALEVIRDELMNRIAGL